MRHLTAIGAVQHELRVRRVERDNHRPAAQPHGRTVQLGGDLYNHGREFCRALADAIPMRCDVTDEHDVERAIADNATGVGSGSTRSASCVRATSRLIGSPPTCAR